jgi:myo-inositol-1(or 4)-monophosphatase
VDDLTAYRRAACEAARQAAVVLEEWRGKFSVREKGRFDLVTDADVASQRAIHQYLLGCFPDHAFLGEEEGASKTRPEAGAPPTWIVDPIDGTTNFVHGLPLYCISIGLLLDGELAVGVVLEPSRNELFEAATGQGAWLGSQRLNTSTIDRLEHALVSTGFAADPASQAEGLAWWRCFSAKTQSLRRTGSTAINLAYLAAGRFDGYFAFDNHVWDVAGGIVLVREAGGVVSGPDGAACDPFSPNLVASNGPLHAEMLQTFRTGP